MKTRRRFFQLAGSAAALLAIPVTGRTGTGNAPHALQGLRSKELEGSFLHTVYFWLTDPTPGNRELFLDQLQPFIRGVKEIRTWHIGTPAGTDREVIDSSYSYCLSVSFNSKKEHDIYQEHPLHKQFIENAAHLWERVVVYDSVKL